MVPTLPEDSIIVSLPFGGAVLRSLGCSTEEVNVLLEETRKKFVMEKGGCVVDEVNRLLSPLERGAGETFHVAWSHCFLVLLCGVGSGMHAPLLTRIYGERYGRPRERRG